MKELLDCADRYMKKVDWKDRVLMQVALCSMGVMIGTSASDKAKKPVRFGAKFLFVTTCVPLAIKTASVFLEVKPECKKIY
ncbi:permease of phosphate ABC transporter [Aminipila luticellarii]|uniref:Permease of phosphate ABC transporter n=1 Tax=Aminipila luticellarii TaxID=2507160 RepID=A0A410PX84_9FIRM|nr:permease of phosphate ABC transporter [Aminipila luticellarii]QAT43480.1 permease of phosphate ABC transporter [Aminipila luticellarii]